MQLGAPLRAAGFKTKLVIPDDENPAEAYRRAVAVLQDPKARQYVGALAYHTYSEDLSDIVRLRQLGTKYSLPVWMTEWNNGSGSDWRKAMGWAERMHLVLTVGGVNAVDYMWGYFGSWDPAQLLSIDFSRRHLPRFLGDTGLLAHRPILALRPARLRPRRRDTGRRAGPDERLQGQEARDHRRDESRRCAGER